MSSQAPRWPTPPPTYEHPTTTTTSLKPYLTLPYLLSLTWLAYPILSLLFVAFRLQLSLGSAENAVSDAKHNLLASCQAAEQSATSAASLPRYMAVGTNKQIAAAVNSTMNGAREALVLSLTAMEAIINFVIDIYRSTFLCFLELVIRGGLAILIGAVQELQQFVQSTMSSIRTSIQNDIASANSAISSAVSGVNKILPFGAHINIPQFSIPSLNALSNVTLPTDFETALTSLNSSIPSLDALRTSIQGFVDTPFELVKTEINDTFLGLSFNASVLPVPQINTVSFCNQLNTGIVDDLGLELIKVARIGTILLILLALLLLAGHCLLEWYKWRSLRQSLQRTRSAWSTDPTVYHVTAVTSTPSLHMTDHNLLTLHATSTHPLLSRLANWIAATCHLSPSQFIHLHFFFHYIFHPPALACFLIGFFGLLSVELQLIALGPVQKKFSQQVSASVSSFGSTIADSMNAAMQNQSSAYAESINGQLSTMQSTINNGLFGWVNGTTTTLNNTIVTFYTDVQNTVTAVLGGTILDQPAQDFVRCIIGSKVQALENVLTFLNENLRIDLPVLNQSVLLLSPTQMNEVAQPISAAAIGSGGSGGGIVGTVVSRYINDLKKERLMFGIFIGLWGVVVFVALCIVFWHSYGKAWWQVHSRKRWLREQRGDVDSVVRPWTHGATPSNSIPLQSAKEKNVFTSFTPMDSPKKIGFFAALRKSAVEHQGQLSAERTTSNSTSKSSRNDWSYSNKLMAIGRKAAGQERLVPDEDTEKQTQRDYSNKAEVFEVEVREEKGTPWWPWWRRLWNRRASIDSFESDGELMVQPRPVAQRRTGPPNLKIETNIIPPKSQRDRYPVIVQGESQTGESVPEPLASAWSISPVTKPTPWTKPLPVNTLPLRLKPRPNAALPQSVASAYSPSLTLSNVTQPRAPPPLPRFPISIQESTQPRAVPPPVGYPVPIHYEFVRPVPRETPSSPSPPITPVFNTSSRPASRPVDKGSKIYAQASPQTMVKDPFATCFDDEYCVQPDPPAKRVSTTNPFADMGTPMAV